MKRRKLIQYSTIGTASLIVDIGLSNSKRADAFPIFLLGNPVLRFVFGRLAKTVFSAFQVRNQQWWDKRLDVQLAQREFIHQQFTDVTVAEVNSPHYSVIVGSEKRETLGNNAAIAFPRVEDEQPRLSAFAGPASLGMAFAAQYLQENTRMTVSQIQAAILPSLQGGANYSDMRGWSDSTSFRAYPNNYSDTGVRIRYDAIDPRSSGFGTIDVTVNANRLIQIPQIRVNFA